LETGTHCEAQVDLECMILLLHPPGTTMPGPENLFLNNFEIPFCYLDFIYLLFSNVAMNINCAKYLNKGYDLNTYNFTYKKR
jgi:hypothetical protein